MVLVTTTQQVLAIADALERAAVRRYEALGACMRRVGHAELARIFEALAQEERQHVESVEHLMQTSASSGSTGDIAGLALPETFEIGDAAVAARLTPYTALSIAVRGEEQAFSFWTYVASEAANGEVRGQAEAMARQELVHAAKLRHARRQAYHAERQGRQPEATDALDDGAMQSFVARQERETAAALRAATQPLEGQVDPRLLQQIRGFAASISASADEAAMGSAALIQRAAAVGPVGILFEAAGSVEKLIEQYLVLLRRSEHARGQEEVSGRCEKATAMVAALNDCLYALEPSLTELAHQAPSVRQMEARP
ncbi:ferritin-like domain-containing protein [Dongia sp. agr-C8]